MAGHVPRTPMSVRVNQNDVRRPPSSDRDGAITILTAEFPIAAQFNASGEKPRAATTDFRRFKGVTLMHGIGLGE
jgi:hypothetical protein